MSGRIDANGDGHVTVDEFVDFLIASTEYHSFVQLMSDFASMDAWVDEGAEPLEQ